MSDNPTMPGRVPRRGTRVSATTSHRGQVTGEQGEEVEEVGRPTLFKHPAYVGLSVSKTRSTKFAAKKLEVSVWCSLPCGPSRPERQEALDEATEYVMETLDTQFAVAQEAFFPHTDWDMESE